LLLGISCNYHGRYSEAADLLLRSAEAVHAYVQPDPAGGDSPRASSKTYARYGYVWANAHRAYSLAELGRFPEALRAGEEAIRIAKPLGISYSLVGADGFPAMAHLRRGSCDEAIAMFLRALETAERSDLKLLITQAFMGLGYAEGLAGRLEQGISSLRQSIARDLEVGNPLWAIMARAHLAEIYALAGQPDQAAATAQEAMEIARAQHQPGPGAWALYALGRARLLAASPELAQSRSALEECVRVASDLGMRPLAANAHHRLGEVHAKAGDQDRARAELGVALRMYREMDMRLWPEAAEAALQRLA
jgi:tetratricopeptide (TPR) repeat protein